MNGKGEVTKMRNIRNYGVLTGRLTKEPMIYDNRDGSRKIRFTLAVQDSFTDSEGNRGSQFIPLEAFISAKKQGNGVYDYLDRGDFITCSYTVQNNNYTDKNGEKVYGLALLVDTVSILESRASKEARGSAS